MSAIEHFRIVMGLDSVELVLAVEDVFGISIPDEQAEQLTTVGKLHRFIVDEPVRAGRPNIHPDIVFDLLRNLICMQLGVKPGEVRPDSRFVQDLRIG